MVVQYVLMSLHDRVHDGCGRIQITSNRTNREEEREVRSAESEVEAADKKV